VDQPREPLEFTHPVNVPVVFIEHSYAGF
jgi:hypothetical protein